MRKSQKPVPARKTARTTLADIAAELGLDKSSISLALNDSPKISEETKERIRQTVRRLGYQPNIAARQLRKGGRMAIGLAIPEKALDIYVVTRTIQELARLARENGTIFTIVSCPCVDVDAFVPDGLLAWGEIPVEEVRRLCRNCIPYLVIDPSDPSYRNSDAPCVRIDNLGGVAKIVDHLVERGAERLLFVKPEHAHIGHEERWLGARSQWLKSQPPHLITRCSTEELSDENLKAFAREPRGAIFCSSDDVAARVWHRLTALGLKTPDDVALAGFDGVPYCENFGLTTAVVDVPALAKAAFKGLEGLMDKSAIIASQAIPAALRIGRTT